MENIKKILVPTDFSEHSNRVLQSLLAEKETHDACHGERKVRFSLWATPSSQLWDVVRARCSQKNEKRL
ncbi:MAG: universal stress protein, partial [Gammaproteobacteria bacterium]|nr:universal stress protein [Gammaproteobacteria bacterium]